MLIFMKEIKSFNNVNRLELVLPFSPTQVDRLVGLESVHFSFGSGYLRVPAPGVRSIRDIYFY